MFVRRSGVFHCGLVICVAGYLAVPLAMAADSPEIWMTPMHPHDGPRGGRFGSEDYMDLFRLGAPWQTVEKHVSVFKIYSDFVRRSSDDDIRRVVSGLAAQHIALAVESNILGPTGYCQPGHTQTETISPLMARLKKLGADVRYLEMVGPLVGGHSLTQAAFCHLPIETVAIDAAHTVALIRDIFPDIIVGEIEPVGHGPNFLDWHDLDPWFAAWQKASGKPLAFLHIDVSWTLPWREDLLHFAERAQAHNISFGVILDGGPYELSDKAYSTEVADHVEEIDALLGPMLQQVNFQSWQIYPRRALPESDSSSLTGEILDFLRPATRLTTLAGASGALRLQLTDAKGAPVGNARIIEESLDPGGDAKLEAQSIAGYVPPSATSARIVLRSQTECTCPKRPTYVSLTGFRYTEDGSAPYSWDASAWANAAPVVISVTTFDGAHRLRFSAPAGQPLSLNGPLFPVKAGAPFDLSFAWRIAPESDQAGLVALIFTGADNKEFRRTFRLMSTTWQRIGEVTTNPAGQAVVTRPPTAANATRLRLRYEGDRAHRPAPTLEAKSPERERTNKLGVRAAHQPL